jgi:inositol-phosphate transport system substrate-binding protein
MKSKWNIVRRLLPLTLAFILAALAGCSGTNGSSDSEKSSSKNGTEIETVTVKAAGWRTASAPYTLKNLENAAEKLNEKLEEEDSKFRLKVNTIAKPKDEDLKQYYIFASKSGDAPDIMDISYNEIGWLAEGDYILNLDGIEKEEVFKNLMPGYWDTVTYDEHIWGVVQDTEARPVFFYKPALKSLGWSDEEIANLPKLAEQGEFTLQDMERVTTEAVNQNVVKYGFLDKDGGRDRAMLFYNFGAQMYDEEKKQYVLDKEKVLETFKWYEQLMDKNILPKTMGGDDRLKALVNGEALFAQGGIWEEAKIRNNGYHKELGNVTSEWFNENIGAMLLPPSKKGGKPVTVSGPYTYVISKDTEHPELLKRLLLEASKPEYQKAHAVQSSHIPFTKEGQETVKDNAWLNQVSYMTKYSVFNPNDPNEPKREKIYEDVLKNIQTKEMTPEEALAWMEEQMKLNLDDIVVK